MRAALGGDHLGQRRIHPFGIDELAPAAPGQKLTQPLQLQLLGFHPLTQEVAPCRRTALRLAQRPASTSALAKACCSSVSEIEDLTVTRGSLASRYTEWHRSQVQFESIRHSAPYEVRITPPQSRPQPPPAPHNT